ncbi:molybdopterin synthase small subunit [Erwinia typographi]|uniref:Molybdopterin synthase sulfur carrier subunit n=1 Tax=Erwinia typographi TaxID=371042 RepID=A0A0A3ZV01_9GAMM|nr:molybdopterin synthase sulfur carrier subunit [Erwinia typographi]KGT89438.1 molybdopterin synthase small subunit [Erwinia typographi]
MINVLFFAQIRELVGTGSVTMTEEYATVEALRAALASKGDRWALALESGKVLSAVNQTLVAMQYELKPGDEVAFFPPVTGG